jgi:hypothetical protein
MGRRRGPSRSEHSIDRRCGPHPLRALGSSSPQRGDRQGGDSFAELERQVGGVVPWRDVGMDDGSMSVWTIPNVGTDRDGFINLEVAHPRLCVRSA